jgi:drug/metabolite transporter (DMT)-like permease
MLRCYQPTKIAAFVFLTLVFTLLMGSLWLHEPITPNLIAALALLAVSIIVLVNRKPRSSPCNL